eukprot:TRINITY_DN3225_c1_g1_i1.p1 TRINITY_DN3225_c1_g1~~TRINITY_DN3225_c1_g1_i1.p1  ORF type:complete len:227 (+),score=55.83 TRINITY_DN3225_c1_g1_i1:76-756(+)
MSESNDFLWDTSDLQEASRIVDDTKHWANVPQSTPNTTFRSSLFSPMNSNVLKANDEDSQQSQTLFDINKRIDNLESMLSEMCAFIRTENMEKQRNNPPEPSNHIAKEKITNTNLSESKTHYIILESRIKSIEDSLQKLLSVINGNNGFNNHSVQVIDSNSRDFSHFRKDLSQSKHLNVLCPNCGFLFDPNHGIGYRSNTSIQNSQSYSLSKLTPFPDSLLSKLKK